MKIVFDGRTIRPQRTGVGYYTERLLRALMAVDRDNEYLVLLNDDTLWWTWDIPGNFKARRVGADYESHPWGDLWERFLLPGLLEREQAQLLHGPAFLIPPASCSCPTLVTIHDLTAWRCPGDYPWTFRWYLRRVIRKSCAAATAIVTPSEATARDVRDVLGVPVAKLCVVPEAADSCFQPAGARKASADSRRRLQPAPAGIHPNLADPYILTVGTIEPRKRVELLVAAFEKARRSGSLSHHLVVVGKVGWKARASLRALAESSVAGSIHRLDYLDTADLVTVYQHAGLFVSASRYEGFGLPPLEAMACGVPVVTTPAGSVAEVVGDAGVIVEEETADALAAAMTTVLTDDALRASLAEKALARAAEFSWEAAARKTLEVYKKTGLPRSGRQAPRHVTAISQNPSETLPPRKES